VLAKLYKYSGQLVKFYKSSVTLSKNACNSIGHATEIYTMSCFFLGKPSDAYFRKLLNYASGTFQD